MRKISILAIAFIISCATSTGEPPRPRTLLAGSPCAPATGLDATPDDADPLDVRIPLQAAIDATPAGATLTIPPGTYYVSRYSSSDYGVRINAAITLQGPGATIRQCPATPASVRLIRVDGSGATIARIILDGFAAAQTPDEHRAAIFVAASDVTIEDVTGRDFTGDAFYGYTHADRLRLIRATAIDNGRNGVTLGAAIDGVTISGGTYARNAGQQIDSEPGYPATVDNVTITGATIDAGGSSQHVIAISGSSSATRSHGWIVAGNSITGPINVVWAEDVTIVRNAITQAGLKPCVTLYRTTWHVTIARNTCAMTDPVGTKLNAAGTATIAAYPTAIHVVGTGTGSAPDDVLIADNVIATYAPSGIGVRLEGILSAIVDGNEIHGSGLAFGYASGLLLRATNPSEAIRSAIVAGNSIDGFGKTGVAIQGYTPTITATITTLRVVGNLIGDASTIESVGISLDDGSHPSIVNLSIVANAYGAGVASGRL